MNICQGCGGVVGRDCFNPIECLQISQSMNDDRSYQLEQENQHLREKIKELESILIAHDLLFQSLAFH